MLLNDATTINNCIHCFEIAWTRRYNDILLMFIAIKAEYLKKSHFPVEFDSIP